MNLEAARRIIEAGPNTHLGQAARLVLALLEKADVGRVEAAEAHHSVMNEALAVAREEAERLDRELLRVTELLKDREGRLRALNDLWLGALKKRDAAAAELAAAQRPDPDLVRLRSLDHACRMLVKAIPPNTALARQAFNRVVSHLTPYLDDPKVGP